MISGYDQHNTQLSNHHLAHTHLINHPWNSNQDNQQHMTLYSYQYSRRARLNLDKLRHTLPDGNKCYWGKQVHTFSKAHMRYNQHFDYKFEHTIWCYCQKSSHLHTNKHTYSSSSLRKGLDLLGRLLHIFLCYHPLNIFLYNYFSKFLKHCLNTFHRDIHLCMYYWIRIMMGLKDKVL